MKPRAKRKLTRAVGVGLGLAGLGWFAVSLPGKQELEYERTGNANGNVVSDASSTDENTELYRSLAAIASRVKLQRPLEDPPKQSEQNHQQKPATAIRWPKFRFTGVLLGEKAKLAMFNLNNEPVSCAVGDTFGQVKVLEISEDSVKLEFQGQSKVEKLRRIKRDERKATP